LFFFIKKRYKKKIRKKDIKKKRVKYPIKGVKLKDYMDFKKAAALMQSKAHLTKEGFEEILSLKQYMNRKRTVW